MAVILPSSAVGVVVLDALGGDGGEAQKGIVGPLLGGESGLAGGW
jgi:hypothetical protein